MWVELEPTWSEHCNFCFNEVNLLFCPLQTNYDRYIGSSVPRLIGRQKAVVLPPAGIAMLPPSIATRLPSRTPCMIHDDVSKQFTFHCRTIHSHLWGAHFNCQLRHSWLPDILTVWNLAPRRTHEKSPVPCRVTVERRIITHCCRQVYLFTTKIHLTTLQILLFPLHS